MARQTSVQDAPARAIAGQITGQGPKRTPSKTAEGEITVGQPLLRGTDDDQALPVVDGSTLDATTFLGFGVASTSRVYSSTGTVEINQSLPVMSLGEIYVLLTGPAAAGEAVLCGTATATLGQIQGTAGADLDAAPGARFEESGVSGDLVKISIVRV